MLDLNEIIHTGESVVEMQERIVDLMRQRAERERGLVVQIKRRYIFETYDLIAANDAVALAIADLGRAVRVLNHVKELEAKVAFLETKMNEGVQK